MARFFIDRPVFAWVIAIFIMLGGLFAIRALPVAQYRTSRRPSSASMRRIRARPRKSSRNR